MESIRDDGEDGNGEQIENQKSWRKRDDDDGDDPPVLDATPYETEQ